MYELNFTTDDYFYNNYIGNWEKIKELLNCDSSQFDIHNINRDVERLLFTMNYGNIKTLEKKLTRDTFYDLRYNVSGLQYFLFIKDNVKLHQRFINDIMNFNEYQLYNFVKVCWNELFQDSFQDNFQGNLHSDNRMSY